MRAAIHRVEAYLRFPCGDVSVGFRLHALSKLASES